MPCILKSTYLFLRTTFKKVKFCSLCDVIVVRSLSQVNRVCNELNLAFNRLTDWRIVTFHHCGTHSLPYAKLEPPVCFSFCFLTHWKCRNIPWRVALSQRAHVSHMVQSMVTADWLPATEIKLYNPQSRRGPSAGLCSFLRWLQISLEKSHRHVFTRLDSNILQWLWDHRYRSLKAELLLILFRLL